MRKMQATKQARIACSFLAAVGILIGASVFLLSNSADRTSAIDAASPSSIAACAGVSECFAFTIDTRLTNTVDTDPGHNTGTATRFIVPLGNQSGAFAWTVDWGDGTIADYAGTEPGGTHDDDTVSHTYATPGEYQITIRPTDGVGTLGWLNVFGGANSTSGGMTPDSVDNLCMVKTIDTPFTDLMRSRSLARIFAKFVNLEYIPDNLFAGISTTGETDFSGMFTETFEEVADNISDFSIPAGLFSFLDTTSGVDFSNMFEHTFYSAAENSTTFTIPAGLFDSVHTDNGTNFSFMFMYTFGMNAGNNSELATIPKGLFDSIDTSNGTNFNGMFDYAFNQYAGSVSRIATIPDGLFDSIDTTNGTNLDAMFNYTFQQYALNSLVATIPPDLFNSIDTTNASNIDYIYNWPFDRYGYAAGRSAHFVFGGEIVEKQYFGSDYGNTNTYSFEIIGKDWFGGAPIPPALAPGDKVRVIYTDQDRTVVAPSVDQDALWLYADGTSCLVHNLELENCTAPESTAEYALANSSPATFPISDLWQGEGITPTSKGNAIFYAATTVTLDRDDGTAETDEYALLGEPMPQPTAPQRAGFTFAMWYSDPEHLIPFDFSAPIEGEITLHASWTDGCGNDPVLMGDDYQCTPPVTPTTRDIEQPGTPNTGLFSSIGSSVATAFTGVAVIAIASVVVYVIHRRKSN